MSPLADYERAAEDTRRPGQARLISQGIDQDGIRERLTRLDAVLAYAQTHGHRVTWG